MRSPGRRHQRRRLEVPPGGPDEPAHRDRLALDVDEDQVPAQGLEDGLAGLEEGVDVGEGLGGARELGEVADEVLGPGGGGGVPGAEDHLVARGGQPQIHRHLPVVGEAREAQAQGPRLGLPGEHPGQDPREALDLVLTDHRLQGAPRKALDRRVEEPRGAGVGAGDPAILDHQHRLAEAVEPGGRLGVDVGHPWAREAAPRRTRLSPTRRVTRWRSKCSERGMACLRVAPVRSLKAWVVISPWASR